MQTNEAEISACIQMVMNGSLYVARRHKTSEKHDYVCRKQFLYITLDSTCMHMCTCVEDYMRRGTTKPVRT